MSEHGLVVSRHKHGLTVETTAGQRIACRTRGRAIKPLVGDRVAWQPQADGSGIVTGIDRRDSLLTRIDSRGRRERVAANVDQLIAVVAPQPDPDWFLVDRYLLAAELMQIDAGLVLNKQDLLAEPLAALQVYRDIGYPVFLTSAKHATGLDALKAGMQGHTSVLLGQSGVGKSSLTNALLGERRQAVGDLADKGGHGRHTTTAAALYHLPSGGALIDSPGVRNYSPFIEDAATVDRGFREFAERLGRCRFDNCQHLAEPDCAIKRAVDDGEIDRGRYQSYTKLKALLAALPG